MSFPDFPVDLELVVVNGITYEYSAAKTAWVRRQVGLGDITFAGNVTRHPVYREYLQPFENSDTIMKNGFLLGAHHGMTIEDVDYVCDKIKEFFTK